MIHLVPINNGLNEFHCFCFCKKACEYFKQNHNISRFTKTTRTTITYYLDLSWLAWAQVCECTKALTIETQTKCTRHSVILLISHQCPFTLYQSNMNVTAKRLVRFEVYYIGLCDLDNNTECLLVCATLG